MSARPILIAGAGAIGSIVGAMLRRAGHEVTLLGRENHLNAIARGGLRISGLFGDHVAAGFHLASDPERLEGPFNLILLTVKAYDTASMTERIKHLLGPEGLIVAMQNGVGNLDVLVNRVGASRAIGSRVMLGAEIRAPGHAHATVYGAPLAFGPSASANHEHCGRLFECAREIAAMLTGAGLASEAVRDIAPLLWMKLFYNAALNPLGALLRLNYGALAADPDLRIIMNEVIEEAFAVATALDVPLPYENAEAYRAVFYGQLVPATFNHRPTMLYDLEQRGRTDIMEMNGKVVELAGRVGLRADTNRMLMHFIRARERMWRKEAT
ncbi:MAG TPA: ketopantoate reductase family protein [Candidatus Binataceae bacterium]|nr:ketopantoate reductase family protein [Candidatus Binataceae bacterium]